MQSKSNPKVEYLLQINKVKLDVNVSCDNKLNQSDLNYGLLYWKDYAHGIVIIVKMGVFYLINHDESPILQHIITMREHNHHNNNNNNNPMKEVDYFEIRQMHKINIK
jgi:hypothetical protein